MGAAHTITQREEAGRAGRSRPGERDWVSGRNRRKAGGMRIWSGKAGERSALVFRGETEGRQGRWGGMRESQEQ